MHIPPGGAGSDPKQSNGSTVPTSVIADATSAAGRDSTPDSPGLVQLAACVLGIYASLYVDFVLLYECARYGS